ncbi:hypothetical protein BU14_0333s0021 [Porphyra umbilicalis]|uniref:tRNA-dihydrouridine(16/17) synthase [NAD(P)(+)] n=1 Tax=Porphyra umbilicalis TaxID=2786 RepID=A0A1X6NZ22_PORUM|nr:hypothetical protein BU14_0333s0021 [Porphyra umbilicalis]|eukprot:OSX73633.1 hypothetical protein BU14_0333s0021 [Porphyra umbilicalis]
MVEATAPPADAPRVADAVTPIPVDVPVAVASPVGPAAESSAVAVVHLPPHGVPQTAPPQSPAAAADAAAVSTGAAFASGTPNSLKVRSPSLKPPGSSGISPVPPSSSTAPMATVRAARALTAAGVQGTAAAMASVGAPPAAAGAVAAAAPALAAAAVPAVARPLPPPGRRALNPWPFGRYITAPMVDASELPFRLLTRRHGVSLAYTPMFHATLFSTSARYRLEHWTTCAADRPLAVQFCANDPATLVAAGRYVDGGECDFIDLNLGCPQGIARKGRYGAFLQDDWAAIAALVSTAVRELTTPISAKIRIFPDVAKTVAYARMIEAAGASVLAVHGRTREQKGRTAGPADWEVIRAVKAALSIPVLANGNVNHRGDADACLATTGADAVLSAVWLLENPALFAAPDAPSAALVDRMALAEEYLRLCEEHPVPMRCVRAHLFKLMRSRLNTCMEENGSLGKAKTLEEFRGVLRVLRGKCDDGERFEVRQQRLRLEAAAAADASTVAPIAADGVVKVAAAEPPVDAVVAPTGAATPVPAGGVPPLADGSTAVSAPVSGQKRPWEALATAGASSVVDGAEGS